MRVDHQPQWTRAAGYTAALLSGVAVGLVWALQKHVLDQKIVGPAGLNWLNMLGINLIIWPAYLIRYRRNLFPAATPFKWLGLFACIAAGIFYCRNLGVGMTGATTAAVVTRSDVAFVFVLSYLVLRQRVNAWGWAGTVLLLLGALRVAGVGLGPLSFDGAGLTVLLASAAGVAVNALIITLHFNRIPNELVILASATVQAILFAVIVPAGGGMGGVAQVFAEPRVLGLIALGSAMIAANLFTYYYAMKRAPMWAVRMLALTGAPVAALADHFVLHAPVTAAHLQGLAAVLIGAPLVILSAGNSRTKGGASQEPAKATPTGTDADGS